MSNMAYCRFQNTLEDLRNCEEHIFDELKEDEDRARKRLIELCKSIAQEFSDDDDE